MNGRLGFRMIRPPTWKDRLGMRVKSFPSSRAVTSSRVGNSPSPVQTASMPSSSMVCGKNMACGPPKSERHACFFLISRLMAKKR